MHGGRGGGRLLFSASAVRESLLDDVIVEQWPEGSEPATLWGRSGALRRNTGYSSGTLEEPRGAGAEEVRGRKEPSGS